MKILHVISSLAIGGVPRLLTDLIPYIDPEATIAVVLKPVRRGLLYMIFV